MDEAKFLVKTMHRALIDEECFVIMDGVSYRFYLKEEHSSTILNASARNVREEEDCELSSSSVDVNTFREESSQDNDVSKAPLSKIYVLIETSEEAEGSREATEIYMESGRRNTSLQADLRRILPHLLIKWQLMVIC